MPARAHRISSLPLAELCPLAPVLSEQHGSGRAAAVSTAMHAVCAGQGADEALAALTPEEREEIESWHKPYQTIAARHDDLLMLFDPDEATWEEEVTLHHPGGSTSLGHVDAYLIVGETVLVLDLKRSAFTTRAYPGSLQLAGYGLALADKYDCEAFVPGIWSLVEGEYKWGDRVELDSVQGYTLRERCEYAATHEGQAKTGGHCSDCFQAMHCPEYLLPGAIAEANPDLEALTREDFTIAQASAALRAIQAMETIAAEGKKRLKLYAKHRPIPDGNGKIWAATIQKGRASVSVKKLREIAPEIAEQCTTTGAPFERYTWRNER